MQILEVVNVVKNDTFQWPGGDQERYAICIVYKCISDEGKHEVKIGFGKRETYGKERCRVVIWIDGYPYAEFLASDDIDITGEVLSEIKIYDNINKSMSMCRYAGDIIPQRYSIFKTDSLKRRISGQGVHDAWVVVVNISDHTTMICLAAMRKYERDAKV